MMTERKEALRPDKEKLTRWATRIAVEFDLPEVSSKEAADIALWAEEGIADIINAVRKKAEAL